MNTTIEFSVSVGTKFYLKLTILIFWTKFIKKDYFQLKTGKSKQLLNSAHLHCLGTKLQLKLTISIFSDQICPNSILPVKSSKKVNSTVEFCRIKLFQMPNFLVNWQSGFFVPNLPNIGISSLNQKKLTLPLNSVYLNQSGHPGYPIRV